MNLEVINPRLAERIKSRPWFPPIFVRPGGIEEARKAKYRSRSYFLWIVIFAKIRAADATLAQECVELEKKIRRGSLLAAAVIVPAAIAIAALGASIAWMILALLVAFALFVHGPQRIRSYRRYYEALGFMVETIVEVRDNRAFFFEKLWNEAAARTRYPQFKGWTTQEIQAYAMTLKAEAEDWIRDNWPPIDEPEYINFEPIGEPIA